MNLILKQQRIWLANESTCREFITEMTVNTVNSVITINVLLLYHSLIPVIFSVPLAMKVGEMLISEFFITLLVTQFTRGVTVSHNLRVNISSNKRNNWAF